MPDLDINTMRAWGWIPPEQPAPDSFAALSGGLEKTARNPMAAQLTQAATQAAAGKVAEIKATQRQNMLAGWAADALRAADEFARAPFGYANPPVQMLSDALGVLGLQRTLDRVSYGEPLTTGKGQATRLRNDTVDALGFVPMSPKAALAVASNGLAGGAEKAIFAGVRAKNAPLNMLERAQALEASGAGQPQIYRETGWFKLPDDKWRFEINDHSADTTDQLLKLAPGDSAIKADKAINHNALFDAYPQLRDVDVSVGNAFGSSVAAQSGNRIVLGKMDKPTFLHELQHAVQDIEGFAKGGDPDEIGFDNYWRLLGEVEARNVANRSLRSPMLAPTDLQARKRRPGAFGFGESYTSDVPSAEWLIK